MREIRLSGSEGGAANVVPTPIRLPTVSYATTGKKSCYKHIPLSADKGARRRGSAQVLGTRAARPRKATNA